MTTSITTFKNGVWITKTTDENGNVVTSISDTQPSNATPNTEQCDANTGTATAETVDMPFVSNQCKGVIYTTENLVDKKTGKSIKIKRDANGRITPESQKELDKVQEARSEKILANNRKIQEARDKVNAEKAAEAANENKLIGGTLELNVTLPDGTKLIDKKVEAGHVKTDASISAGKDLGGTVKKAAGKEDVPTPGISLTGTVIISAKGQQTLGMSPKQMEIAQAADKNKDEYDADMKRAEEKRNANWRNPQKAHDQYMKDLAEIGRKWGKKAGEATIK